jgi:malate dehydrogenase (oxaloacetate-decarboxylating)
LIGAGAAGVAIAKLLHLYAKPQIIAVDSKGIITKSRTDLNPEKQMLTQMSDAKSGNLQDALKGADIVIGVSRAGMLKESDIKLMAKDPIVFGLANPEPEIMPDAALKAGAAIVATGRSDFPNQVNNALVFPGIFRGALDNGVKAITDQHKIAVAQAIASLVEQPSATQIIPSVFDDRLVTTVAKAIR